MAQLGGALFAVTMRLHAGILAAAAGTPAAVIDYDPKVRAFAAQTGQAAFAVTADDLETPAGGERLLAAALATARDLDARRRDLRRRVASLKARGRANGGSRRPARDPWRRSRHGRGGPRLRLRGSARGVVQALRWGESA